MADSPRKSLRVAFVLPDFPWRPVGGFRVVYEYANRLVERGHAVSVVHARRCEVPRSDRVRRPFSVKESLRPAARFLRARLLRPRLDWHDLDSRVAVSFVPNLDPSHVPPGDIVVATSWRTAPSVAGYGEDKGTKFYLLQHHETWDGTASAVNATWRLPLRKIVIARWLQRVGRELGVAESEMRYIPNGIDRDVYTLTRPITERPRRVAALCHRADWKGGRDAVAALEIARRQVPDLQAVMFGALARPRWVPRWVEYQQDPEQKVLVDEIYNGSSVYLCASWSEGWHLPPAEAMACGCAVVATNIDGVADFAIDRRTALLGRPKEPESLASCLVELLQDDIHRFAIARAGHELIAGFDWSNSTTALEDWFLEEAGEGKRAESRSEGSKPSIEG